MKKILLLILVSVLMLSVVSCGKKAADDFAWEIEEGTLIISGNGRMPDFVDDNGEKTARPWEDRKGEIEAIEVEEGITYIGAYSFYECTSIVEVTLPESLKEIGKSAFWRCIGINDIRLPENLETIGEHAFNSCYGLYTVNIPESVRTVKDYAFKKCYTLSKAVIPESVEKIGKEVFVGSLDGTEVIFGGTTDAWKKLGGEAICDDTVTVKCSDGTFGE